MRMSEFPVLLEATEDGKFRVLLEIGKGLSYQTAAELMENMLEARRQALLMEMECEA